MNTEAPPSGTLPLWMAQAGVLIDKYNQLMLQLLNSKNVIAEFARNSKLTNEFVSIELLNLYLMEFIGVNEREGFSLDTAYMSRLLEGTSAVNNTDNAPASRINIFYLLPNWIVAASYYSEKIVKFYQIISRLGPLDLKVFLCRILIFYKRTIQPITNLASIDANYIDEECIRVDPGEVPKEVPKEVPMETISERGPERKILVAVGQETPSSAIGGKRSANQEKKSVKRQIPIKGILRIKKGAPSRKTVRWNNEDINEQRMSKCLRSIRKNRRQI